MATGSSGRHMGVEILGHAHSINLWRPVDSRHFVLEVDDGINRTVRTYFDRDAAIEIITYLSKEMPPQ